jgi:exodeoxyribonuclease VII small subunit
MPVETNFADIAEFSFEQARDELTQVVARLETGGEPLEGALALWERGEALANRCQEWLDGARVRLEAVAGNSGPAPRSTQGTTNSIGEPF